MSNCRVHTILLTCILLVSFTRAQSQVLCPPNLDFEFGNFNNWDCQIGFVQPNVGITWIMNGQFDDRHTIIPANSGELDMYGGFPVNCPNGSGFSVKLGNNLSGGQAEGISYTYTIPANVTTFSIIYHYAIVMQDPNHTPPEQPRFKARIIDLSTNQDIPCVSFDFTASASLPGFIPAPGFPQVIYKDWTPITIDLGAYAGKTIRLEFTTSDCTLGGHFGYAYIDVDASCSGAISGSTICQGDTSITLKAPFGFQSYEWYSNTTFSTPLGFSQTLLLDPAPTVGSIFPVIVTPYPGFGCRDTLYATVTTSLKPPSFAGLGGSVCRYQSVQLGAPPTTGYGYSWTPGMMLNNPAVANPFTTTHGTAPTQFILKTTDLATGCFSYDTTIVNYKQTDTSMSIAGKLRYCQGETINTTLTVSPAVTAQWFKDDVLIPGAIGISYQPTTNGVYWAQVLQNGCVDSTRKATFSVNPYPIVDFEAARDTQCVNVSFMVQNNTTIPGDELISWHWTFSSTDQSFVKDPDVRYTAPGDYRIKLVATSSNGCKDSLEKPVKVFPNASPDFRWDSICTDRPVQFTNLSNENGAVNPQYEWDFGNSTTSTQKDPPLVTYTNEGLHNVNLTITSVGCEVVPQSISKPVNAYAAADGIRYRTQTRVDGTSTYISARNNIGNSYQWIPSVQLSDDNVKNPLFTAINDVEYKIEIIDKHGCLTTDTLQMLVLKKPGMYLPSAFTPNGDGLNDIIKPYLLGMKGLKKFTIFNRGGTVVFTTSKEGEGWNGTYKGLKLDSGVFVWVIEYINSNDQSIIEKGTISLIR